MADSGNQSLLELLGRTDAIFTVPRDWSRNSKVVAQWDAQSQFFSHGVPIWGSGGGDEAERKSYERWLTEMERTGRVLVTRRRKCRTHWKLSDRSDWLLRRMSGGDGFWSVAGAMWAISGHAWLGATLRDTPAEACVAEFQLVGCEPKDRPSKELNRRCQLLEDMLLPAMCRKWVGVVTDIRGTSAYAVTKLGQQILDDVDAYAATVSTTEEHSADAEGHYWSGFEAGLAELERAKPVAAGAVAVAVSAGCWSWYPDRKLQSLTLFLRNGELRSSTAIQRAYERLTR